MVTIVRCGAIVNMVLQAGLKPAATEHGLLQYPYKVLANTPTILKIHAPFLYLGIITAHSQNKHLDHTTLHKGKGFQHTEHSYKKYKCESMGVLVSIIFFINILFAALFYCINFNSCREGSHELSPYCDGSTIGSFLSRR